MQRLTILLAGFAVIAVIALVTRDGDPAADRDANGDAGGPLVVYSGRSESMVGELLEQFQQDTGISLSVRYNGTPQITTQLLAEGRQSPADVVFLQESGYLATLAAAELLQPLPEEALQQVNARFRDTDGYWAGTSGRARVLVYNTEAVSSDELPATLAELSDPRWQGRLGWAPGNGSFQSHVSVLRQLWGETETREWLAAVAANEPRVYPRNSPQVNAAAAGEIDIGWVNHYYLHQLSDRNRARVANASFSEDGDAGNVLMLAGVAITAHSARQHQARTLVRWLVERQAQEWFAQTNFEYPVRDDVATHQDVPALDSLRLADVQQDWMTDVGPTLRMLRQLGLL